VIAWQFWNAPSGEAPLLRRLQARRCGQTGGRPEKVIAKVNAAIRDTLADPSVKERFRAVGQDVWPADEQTPEATKSRRQKQGQQS
jgi:hypothetical protein